MKSARYILFVLLLLKATLLAAQPEKKLQDLKPEWRVLRDDAYVPFDDAAVKTVYFSVDASRFQGGVLEVRDFKPFALFINRQLIVECTTGIAQLPIDSLRNLYSSAWAVSIFQRDGIRTLSTAIAMPGAASADDLNPFVREGSYFLDFALTVALVIAVYLVFLITSNPRLALDYLNAAKLFSIQERESNLLASRITSRVNLLFYLFCSVFCSLLLLILFHLSGDIIPLGRYFPVRSAGEGFLQWAKLSVLVSLLLALKLVIVLLFSRLFTMRETAAIQFFHFVRALFLAAGFITLISLIIFIVGGAGGSLYFMLLKMGAGILVTSAGMMYLKLLGLTRYHFFHLFSYLCATEIIPLVILLKVLLY